MDINAIDSYITVTEHHITDDKSYARETQWGLNYFYKTARVRFRIWSGKKSESSVYDNARHMECAGDMCPEWSDN